MMNLKFAILKTFSLSFLLAVFFSEVGIEAYASEVKNIQIPIIQTCQINGKVLSIDDLSMLGVSLTFKSKNFKKEFEADEFGEYKIYVPNNKTYIIDATDKYKNLSYQRAPLYVSCLRNEIITINIYPLANPVSYGDTTPRYKFDTVNNLGNKNDYAVLSYQKKVYSEDQIQYRFAMLTYSDLTLSAQSITRYKRRKDTTIIAKGNVWLEDKQNRRKYYEKLRFTFLKGKIIFQQLPTAAKK